MKLIIKKRPRAYPITLQQLKFKIIAKICGVHKGMSKAELQRAMKECIGPLMRGKKDGNKR